MLARYGVVLLVISPLLSAGPLVYARSKHVKPEKASVHLIASSTFVRTTWGMNEDIYLAKMHDSTGLPSMIRLIDEYPSVQPPLGSNLLKTDGDVKLKIIRDSSCDRPFRQILIRTAPGDLMAILPEPLEYDPHLKSAPQPDEMISCYRLARR